jgi:predicted RNA-binding Zn-ribbon protein involved in translation (DUF1610 family)
MELNVQKCRCPNCGAPLAIKGGNKEKAKLALKLFFVMQAEPTYVCPKCGSEQKSRTVLVR